MQMSVYVLELCDIQSKKKTQNINAMKFTVSVFSFSFSVPHP